MTMAVFRVVALCSLMMAAASTSEISNGINNNNNNNNNRSIYYAVRIVVFCFTMSSCRWLPTFRRSLITSIFRIEEFRPDTVLSAFISLFVRLTNVTINPKFKRVTSDPSLDCSYIFSWITSGCIVSSTTVCMNYEISPFFLI
jgi:hypothetical protein